MSHPQGGAWEKTPTRLRDALQRVSFEAEAVWHMISLYCAATGLRGVVEVDELHAAVGRKISHAKAYKHVEELARVGVDIVSISGGQIDLGDFWREENPAPDIWHDQTQRERWARDKRLKRDSALCGRIKARDRNLCRYCGVRVNWNDKVGPTGGTYDHVDPDGGNEEENVVVACRQCNGRKSDRTPDQWVAEGNTDGTPGFDLLPPGTTAATAAVARSRDGPRRAGTGSTPGQPPASRRSAGSGRSRARPDRANPGSTPGQPQPPLPDTDTARPSASQPTRRRRS